MDSALGRTLLRLTGACLLAVAVVALVAPRAVNTVYRWWVVVPVVVGCVALAGLARAPRWVARRWVGPGLAVVGGVVATVVGLAGRYAYGWDARVVLEMARTLHAGRPLDARAYGYLSLYPNNLPLVAIDRGGVELAAALGLSPDAVLVTASGVCVAVTLAAVHALVRQASGPGAAVGAQLVTLVLVGTSPWLAVPYTDYYAMPFLVGGVALAARALRPGALRARGVRWVAAVLCLSVAYAVKTTPAVVVVAAVLTLVVVCLERPPSPGRRWRALSAGAVAAVLFGGVAALTPVVASAAAGVDADRIRPDVTPPVLWWLANGSNEQVGGDGRVAYGTYNRTMVAAIDGLPPVAATAYARGYLADRWAERGLGGTLAFYGAKAAWNWGDGMFWAWGEGTDAAAGPVAGADGVAGWSQAVNAPRGVLYPWRSDVAQGLWLAVLLVAGAGLLRAPYRREVVLLALTVVGIAAFTLLFQGRSRYLFTFAPVVVALAGIVRLRLRLRPRPRPRRVRSEPDATAT